MTQLSSAQLALLTKAAAAAGAEVAPETARSAASLIRRGLLISLPRPGAPSRLMITAAGREAAGLAAEPSPARKRKKTEGAKPRPAPTASHQVAVASVPNGKLGALVALLQRPQGATIGELMTATGWQAHSVRGAIAGAVKKRLGCAVESTKAEGGGRLYRIAQGAGA